MTVNLEYEESSAKAYEKETERLSEITRALESKRRLKGMENYSPNRKQMAGHLSVARTVLYCGGNRAGKCCTIRTIIETTSGNKTVGELYERGEPFEVYAWDGGKKVVANASAPFKKDGIHKCYRITLSDGRWVEVADRHRILMQSGHWAYVDDLYVSWLSRSLSSSIPKESSSVYGQVPEVSSFLRESNSDIFQSVHSSDAPSSLRIEQDCQDYYLIDSRQCDEQLLEVLESFQLSFPLLGDAREQSCGLSHEDALESKYSDILQQYELLPSNKNDQLQVSDQFSSPCETPFYFDCNSIISYSSIGYQEVYDFEVKEYHNYFAGGLIHHNSTFGAMEMAYAMTKRYPEWYPMKRRFQGATKGVVSATSFGVVMRVIEPKLSSLLPRDSYVVKRTAQGFPSQYKFKDGSTLDVVTLEMDNTAYESADWDIAWLDEPQSKLKYQAILRGLVDRRGRMMITFTPLTEPWMKEELADRADGKAIDLIQVDMRDNMTNIAGTTILSEEAIAEFEKEIPDDVKETRLHGKFFHLRGAVYQEFSDEHVKTFEYDKRSPVICVLDPHDRVPHHVIWAWVDRDDDVYVDSEMEIHCELDDLARVICKWEEDHKYVMKKRLIDPNFGRKPARVGLTMSVMQELRKHGCGFYEANDNIELGHMMVRDYLHYDSKRPIGAMNKPKLFLSRERAPKTIRSIRNLQYEEWAGKTADSKDPKEVEKDKENHGADCVRYLIIGRPRYGAQMPEQELEASPY